MFLSWWLQVCSLWQVVLGGTYSDSVFMVLVAWFVLCFLDFGVCGFCFLGLIIL